MQTATTVATQHHWNTIFSKTSKGREAITQRGAGLNAKQRSVLIMLDGSRRLDAVPSAVPQQEFNEIIHFLAEQQLITTERAQPVVSPISAVPLVKPQIVPALIQDEQTLREVKDFMTTTAQTYLGLLSAEIIQKIERAKDAAQLMSILGQWSMALRDSKQGSRFASVYLAQVQATLRDE